MMEERPNQSRLSEPASLVIFGASGDLTVRKLLPALFSLDQQGRLPDTFNIVGFARRPWSQEEFRAQMHNGIKQFAPGMAQEASPSAWERFAQRIYYVQGSFDTPESFDELDHFLTDLSTSRQMPDNRLYYLAAPPQSYDAIVEHLGCNHMSEEASGWRRIVVEKPFGTDLASAQHLNKELHHCFREQQIYRIDHYLGKETVQNILVLRFANRHFRADLESPLC